jgi:hypothetical protein
MKIKVTFLVVVGCAIALMGCGKKDATTFLTSGTVTFEGNPVESGMITMFPLNNQTMMPDTGKITNGKFSFSAKPGKKRIEIHASKPGKFNPEMNTAERIPYIPEKYNVKSTLEKEISATGKNEFEFKLTK